MQNKMLKKYVLEDDIYLDENKGIPIFYDDYDLKKILLIKDNKLVIEESFKKEFELDDSEIIDAIVITLGFLIEWTEKYVIQDNGAESTIFMGNDGDNYYSLRVETGITYECEYDGNGGSYIVENKPSIERFISWCNGDLKANEEYLFEKLEKYRLALKEEIVKYKEKPKFISMKFED